jgi:NADPH-dependent curcumin reductase CurA
VQIAKLYGHTVVASAGSAQKCAFVRDELGADVVFSYLDGEVRDLLRGAAPDGIDLYFDNVGGDHLEAALERLRPGGRVALCGAIGDYNATEPVRGPSNLFEAVVKGLTLRGFLARMYADRLGDFRDQMRVWLAEGRIVYPETVLEGIEQAPEAFMAMMRGENVGKMLVKLR